MPRRSARRAIWPLTVVVATAVFATIPKLVTTWFYQRGDTAVQFAPTWFHLGELVRGGSYPPWMDPSTWAGGNYAAEALFGIYDPLNIPVWLVMSAGSNLMTTMFLVKLVFMVLLALGTYLLCREYDAEPWAAASAAVALPFCGFTLFWDAASWASGLVAFAYTPWVWYVLRRVLRGTANPFWGFVLGALAVTQGNPYGVLALVVVGLALVVEGLLTDNRAGVVKLVGAGACAALLLPLVFLPLLDTSGLTVRSLGALIANTGKLQPKAGDFLQASNPTAVPPIIAITGPNTVPATYLAWFVLPFLPWLRWGELRGRLRPYAGPLLVSVVYLGLVLAPSKLWQFRWPLRVTEYFYLGLLVLFARVLSQGLATGRRRERLLGSAVLIAFPAYLAWAGQPADLHKLAAGSALVVVLTAGALLAARLGSQRTVALAGVLIVGTGLTVALQLASFGENKGSRVWHAPADVATLRAHFDGRQGTVAQFSDFRALQHQSTLRELTAKWRYFLPGSLYDVTDVAAVNHYTGMGLVRFERSLCMSYDGFTKPCGYHSIFQPPAPSLPPLADLMKVQTIVVGTKQAKAAKTTPPAGWTQVTANGQVQVYRRSQALPWPASQLSFVPNGVQVAAAGSDGLRHQHVDLTTTANGGQAVFAMLGWPGWRATLHGRALPVGRDSAGLLTVTLPANSSGRLELTYLPPGLKAGIGAAALGLLGALALGWFGRRRKDPVATAARP
ncbi:MAG TPA: hypothetical protein VHW64_16845 [Nocardioides sp.]|uniref:hypothetical protein n=1 Tax=Nocardioides sp. TaxID=35761 RepID=UPI002E31347A|nr:hypothetical protein [Nocardioides sp.]HEX3932367.1 hypothetical protein [Nocardioides sp.]